MMDATAAATLALTAPSPAAVGLLFVAGTITSVGPCVAPRYVAIAAIVNGYPRPIVPTVAFVGGLVSAFMALGFGAGVVGNLGNSSSLVYALLALGLIAAGCVTLVRAVPQRCAAGCDAGHHHAAAQKTAQHRSLGAVYLLGATSALVVSPCCTPVLGAIVATSTAIGKPVAGMLLLASFALGHALPLFFAGSVASGLRRVVRWRIPEQVPAIIGGVLMLTLGAYYGALA